MPRKLSHRFLRPRLSQASAFAGLHDKPFLLRSRDLSPFKPARPSRDQRERHDTLWAFRYRSLWSRLGKWCGLLSFSPAPPEAWLSCDQRERCPRAPEVAL